MKDLINRQKSDLKEFLIPEPTKSLLWITDENPNLIQEALSVRVNAEIQSDGNVKFVKENNGFYSEPSLIWTKLLVTPNNALESESFYWPSYSRLTPEMRYQYLNWLCDITQPTNLSYVFLYFYGLERHLLIGEYDLAVDEIIRLLKHHPKKSFVEYATRSLVVASLAKQRFDIIERAPFIMQEELNETLALRILHGTEITADDIVNISSKVGFKNNRYIKNYPKHFLKNLNSVINKFEGNHGRILKLFPPESFEMELTNVFANMSIPESIRMIKVPNIIKNEDFSKTLCNLLTEAHQLTKLELKENREKAGKVEIKEIVVGKFVCPNCGSEIEIRKRNKTKCPKCKKSMILVDGSYLSESQLEEKKKLLKMERTNRLPKAYKKIYFFITTKEPKSNTRAGLLEEYKDLINTLEESKNYDLLGSIYLQMGVLSFDLKSIKDGIRYYVKSFHYTELRDYAEFEATGGDVSRFYEFTHNNRLIEISRVRESLEELGIDQLSMSLIAKLADLTPYPIDLKMEVLNKVLEGDPNGLKELNKIINSDSSKQLNIGQKEIKPSTHYNNHMENNPVEESTSGRFEIKEKSILKQILSGLSPQKGEGCMVLIVKIIIFVTILNILVVFIPTIIGIGLAKLIDHFVKFKNLTIGKFIKYFVIGIAIVINLLLLV